MSSSSSSDVVVLDDEPEPLQLRERILYKRSPARVKTLDILAKSSSFSSLSLISLKKYCSLAREEGGATSVEQAGAFLEKRYEWNVSTRVDFQEAWNATVPESGEKEAVASASNLKTEKEANDVHPDRVSDQHIAFYSQNHLFYMNRYTYRSRKMHLRSVLFSVKLKIIRMLSLLVTQGQLAELLSKKIVKRSQ